MLKDIEAKIKEVTMQLEQSIANHNFLLGAKASLEQMAIEARKAAAIAEEATNVAQTVATVVEEVIQ